MDLWILTTLSLVRLYLQPNATRGVFFVEEFEEQKLLLESHLFYLWSLHHLLRTHLCPAPLRTKSASHSCLPDLDHCGLPLLFTLGSLHEDRCRWTSALELLAIFSNSYDLDLDGLLLLWSLCDRQINRLPLGIDDHCLCLFQNPFPENLVQLLVLSGKSLLVVCDCMGTLLEEVKKEDLRVCFDFYDFTKS